MKTLDPRIQEYVAAQIASGAKVVTLSVEDYQLFIEAATVVKAAVVAPDGTVGLSQPSDVSIEGVPVGLDLSKPNIGGLP